ncbi:hypothetical protein DLM45_15010 [Hyphomicrobium methylovorum]|uniref:DUF2939 domain-containing protein n=1 Tax=Hyphomicrobium methylovorum TaxID=84 RepID=UPI0015E6B954|nr:DUF2939 domain-containing protein [Hyphomicrobium methylovorum]MBA2127521.1 hypothetical protein [Hyphomicrobium methylovorum]
MKPLLALASAVVFAATIYIAAPFVTAWNIREAVRSENATYLATAIEWPSVRATLKPSIARIALDLPEGAANAAPDQNAGLWQRLKAYWGQSAVDSIVESYVTPDGLPKLFSLRKAYRDYVSGADDPANTLPMTERIAKAWSRVKRAEFTGFTTVEIDMEDKLDPTRVYLGKLELTRRGWMLTELRVKFLTTAGGAIQNFVAAPSAL